MTGEGTEQREAFAHAPVTGGAFALQQTGSGQDQRTGTHGGQIAGIKSQTADLAHKGVVFQRLGAAGAARYAQHVATRDFFQLLQLGKVQSFGADICATDGGHDNFGTRHVSQELQWPGKVQLGDALIDRKNNH
ncbi:hypothetical protein D3C76_1427740 [compost metagenome]